MLLGKSGFNAQSEFKCQPVLISFHIFTIPFSFSVRLLAKQPSDSAPLKKEKKKTPAECEHYLIKITVLLLKNFRAAEVSYFLHPIPLPCALSYLITRGKSNRKRKHQFKPAQRLRSPWGLNKAECLAVMRM